MSTYDRGDMVRLSNTFTDVDGNPADPTTVTLRVKDPNGAVTVYTGADVTKDDTGDYHVDVAVDVAGTWYYRWEGTGTLVSAGERSFEVRPSRVIV